MPSYEKNCHVAAASSWSTRPAWTRRVLLPVRKEEDTTTVSSTSRNYHGTSKRLTEWILLLSIIISCESSHPCRVSAFTFGHHQFRRQASHTKSTDPSPSSSLESSGATAAIQNRVSCSYHSNHNIRSPRCPSLLGAVGKSGATMLETAEDFARLVLNQPSVETESSLSSSSSSFNTDDDELSAKKKKNSNKQKKNGSTNAGTPSASSLVVLVFWTAPWCGPCRLSIPVVKEVLKQYSSSPSASSASLEGSSKSSNSRRKGLVGFEVCTDDLPEVASDAGVVSIPTIQLYDARTGRLMDTIIGCVAKSVLLNAVEKVEEEVLAMAAVSENTNNDD